MARVLSKDLISRVMIAVEPVKISTVPASDLCHVWLLHLCKLKRREEFTSVPSAFTSIAISTERVTVQVIPVMMARSIVKVTCNNGESLLPRRDEREKSLQLSFASN